MTNYDEYKFTTNEELDDMVNKWFDREVYFIINTNNPERWEGPVTRFKEYSKFLETIPPFGYLYRFIDGPTRIRLVNVSRGMDRALAEFILYLNLRVHDERNVVIVLPQNINKIEFQNTLLNYASNSINFKILHNQDEELYVEEGDVERREWEIKKRNES